MKIKIVDPIICQTDEPDVLREFLFVEKKYWTGNKSGFGKEEHKYNFPLVSKKGVFLAGFLPRILQACQTRSIPVEVIGE